MSELSASEMLASVSSESSTPSTSAGEVSAQPAAQQPSNTPWYAGKEKESIEYVIEGGKKIAEPLEMVLKRAGLGYNYAQRAHQLSQQAERFKQLEEQNKSLSRWNEYDEYAKQNPEWAKWVEEGWNNRTNYQGQNSQNGELQKKIQEYEDRLKKFESFAQTYQESAEDKVFSEEISSVGKQFGVDLSQSDENGQTLEWRVLEHMKALGLNGSKKGHFTAAFKDMYYDNLITREKESAKEAYAKSQAELKKAGIREISRTPKGQNSFNGANSDLSWNQLSELALQEVRASKN